MHTGLMTSILESAASFKASVDDVTTKVTVIPSDRRFATADEEIPARVSISVFMCALQVYMADRQ